MATIKIDFSWFGFDSILLFVIYYMDYMACLFILLWLCNLVQVINTRGQPWVAFLFLLLLID